MKEFDVSDEKLETVSSQAAKSNRVGVDQISEYLAQALQALTRLILTSVTQLSDKGIQVRSRMTQPITNATGSYANPI